MAGQTGNLSRCRVIPIYRPCHRMKVDGMSRAVLQRQDRSLAQVRLRQSNFAVIDRDQVLRFKFVWAALGSVAFQAGGVRVLGA